MFQRIILPFLLTVSLLAGASAVFAARAKTGLEVAADGAVPTVVIDAGHGGEDGGAVSAGGLLEKDVNLDIALRLRDLLTANGIPVVMTRTEDTLLYDKNANYQGRKKALDLAARRQIAEETPDCLFVSIHMNAYPDARYDGLQVWYSPNHPASASVAETIQRTARELLQPENDREIKAAGSSIYLLHRLTVPAVLVECGFLSNPAEAAKLSTDDYRGQVAFTLFLAISEVCGKTTENFAKSAPNT